MSGTPKLTPVLLVYKEIGPGDMRKLLARSNDSSTGGGARDLRLPWRTFRPVMCRIFTETAVGKGGREIRTARVTYKEKGSLRKTTLEYWPATTSRPAEDRVSKIHSNPALAGGRLPDQGRGRVFLIFIKWSNEEVRCYYAYENDLKTPGKWDSEVRQAILGCMSDTDLRNSGRTGQALSVQGYYDFLDGTVYCHANG